MKTKTWINLIVVIGLLFASFGVMPNKLPTALAATIIYVKPGGSTSAGCGSTWANACEMQTALATASAGEEIWVAAGTYKPGTNREDTFQLISGVALYGGFAGTETAREQRDWDANPTVLSGDIGAPDDDSDNSYHVVTGSGVDATTILDGFTVTGGNADDMNVAAEGGGMYNYGGNPSLTNVTFSNNAARNGSGIFNIYSNPTLLNVIFNENIAGNGGGMYNQSCDPILTNVTFSGNSSSDGGGIYNRWSNPTLIDVTFSDNTAVNGGGMYNSGSSPIVTDVIFRGNQAMGGGGMSNYGNSEPVLVNVIFIGNSAGHGGGMYNSHSNPSMTNVIFIGNYGDYDGGGMYNDASSPSLTNVTFSGNQANYNGGGGMYNESNSNPTIINSILWGNTVKYQSGPQIYNEDDSAPIILYSNIQGGCAAIPGNDCSGGGNVDADPLFVRNPDPGPDGYFGTEDDDYGDLRLKFGSPMIDAGDNTAPGLAGITIDLGGNPRFYDVPGIADTGVGPAPVVDIGAYEKQANDAPSAGNDLYETYEDVSLNISAPGIMANDSDPDGTALSAVLENGPSSGNLNLNSDGSFDYFPEANFTGVVTFTYHVSDGVLLSKNATVTITINKNYAPVAVNDTYTITEEEILSIPAPGVLKNDSDLDGDPLSAVLESEPSKGSLDINPDGSFDYRPEKDYSGLVTFTYHASDGSLNSNTATVTITVSRLNTPIAVNDSYATPKNTKLTINAPGVLKNDSDLDGDPLSAVLESGPSIGTLTLNPNGSFDYRPEKDYSGLVTFTYHASDGLLDSNPATVTINVNKIGSEVYLPLIVR